MANATQELKVQLDLTDESAAKLAIAVTPLLIRHLLDGRSASMPAMSGVPAIGSNWMAQSGTYAGVVRGDEGQPDYHLIVAAESHPGIDWNGAIAWAKGLSKGDFELPKRKEQAVMFGNVPELFEKAYYWSAEQYASAPDYAWGQYFASGYQGSYHKTNELRARAVRRLIIQ